MHFTFLSTLALVLSVAQASPLPAVVEERGLGGLGSGVPIVSGAGSGFLAGGGAGALDVTNIAKLTGSGSGAITGSEAGALALPIAGGGKSILGVGAPEGLLGTGLLAGPGGHYSWQCPSGWVRPTWYEFGYFHPTTAVWINDLVSIEAYLRTRAIVDLQIASASSLVLYSASHYPARALDRTRVNRFGYYTQAGLFVDLDLSLDVSILLGSCGWGRRY